MKTKKELDVLKRKVTELGQELRELTEDELREVVGGIDLANEWIGRIRLGIGHGVFTPTEDISDDTKNNS